MMMGSPAARAAVAAFVTLICQSASAAPPHLDPRAPILCTDDERGLPVRIQCDGPATGPGVCLVASACVGGRATEGRATCEWIERVGNCEWVATSDRPYATIIGDRRVVEAIPDAAPGWWRDDDGRAFQVAFDLNQRYWLGARWVGRVTGEDANQSLEGVGLDMGFRIDALDGDLRTKRRWRFLEADLTLAPLTLRARLFALDTSNDGDEPFLRVTTFIGEPQRHDIFLTAGWFSELVSVEHAPRGSKNDSFLRFAAVGLTWDLWHDATMTSFVRLRGGVALDDIIRKDEDERIAGTPIAALEADLSLDGDGFHHVSLVSTYEASYFDDPSGDGIASVHRFTNELAYELILIALNDQPLSLRLAVGGGHRDDLSDPTKNGWDFTATAGLRISLIAPAPDYDERARAEARQKERGL